MVQQLEELVAPEQVQPVAVLADLPRGLFHGRLVDSPDILLGIHYHQRSVVGTLRFWVPAERWSGDLPGSGSGSVFHSSDPSRSGWISSTSMARGFQFWPLGASPG